jgi:5'-nucleotidase / UDP-sugar diphosphatase
VRFAAFRLPTLRYRPLLTVWLLIAAGCAASSQPIASPAPGAPPAQAQPAAAQAPAATGALSPFGDEPSAARAHSAVTLLQLNDVYATSPIEGRGGLARVATLKRRIAAAGRTPLLVMAGDFLSPSVASSVFKGEQMVAALNSAGLDIATFGNHEFDFGVDVLRQRLKESRFTWVNSNVVERNGQPMAGTVPYLVREFSGVRVGFIGLCLTTEEILRENLGGLQLLDPYESAAKYLAVLKQEKVDTIVAVTHLTLAEDQALVDRFPEIDVVIGGHEHVPITLTQNRTLITKAGAEAEYVARIDLTRRGTAIDRHFELVPIDNRWPDEPGTASVVANYEKRLGAEMDVVVAASLVDLDAGNLRLRAGETGLGNLFADAIRASAGADVGLINAGTIRGDRIYPAGALTRRTLLAMHPFGNVVVKIEVPGRVLLEALRHGLSGLPRAMGYFPQVSGLTAEVNLSAPDRVRNVRVGGAPLEPDRPYTVALPNYLLTGGDGYTMFGGAKVLVRAEAGELIVSAIEKYVTARRTVSPAVEKRISVIR